MGALALVEPPVADEAGFVAFEPLSHRGRDLFATFQIRTSSINRIGTFSFSKVNDPKGSRSSMIARSSIGTPRPHSPHEKGPPGWTARAMLSFHGFLSS